MFTKLRLYNVVKMCIICLLLVINAYAYFLQQEEFETKTIQGNETRDIPTSYTVKGFRPGELIVFGE